MGLQLTQTGNTKTDINNIINGINSQFNSDAIANVLNIAAYGKITLVIPNTQNTGTTGSFTHSLGYGPMFMAWINIAPVLLPLPLIGGEYIYSSGPKSGGAYPYNIFNAYVDNTSLYVTCFNLANPGGNVISGTVNIFFLIFSKPITG